MRSLPLAVLLAWVPLLGCAPEKCNKEVREVTCSEDGVLEICNPGDFIIRVECGELSCNASAAACDQCGDGTLLSDQGEQCDDANTTNGDGCSSACKLEFCGDGAVNNNDTETCDDGNRNSGDGCDALCQLEVCGDGIVQGAEQCDDGNQIDDDNCSNLCALGNANCGNGVTEAGEVCDDGNNDYADGCRGDCLGVEVCGDGLVDIDVGEQCDDQNLIASDTCNNQCLSQLEVEIDCEEGADLDDIMNNNVSSNSTIILSGTCDDEVNQTISITDKINIIIIGQNNAAIAPETDIFLFNIFNSSVALINLDLSGPNNGGSSELVSCIGTSTLLIDQAFIHNQVGDRAIEIKGSCNAIIANSVFANNPSGNKDVIKLTELGRLDLIHSTFALNSSSEEGIIESNGAQCRFDGVIGQDNGNDPVKETVEVLAIAPAQNAFSFVKDDVFLNNNDPDPKINIGKGANQFHIFSDSPARDGGNPAPDPNALIFNPVTSFGINVYDHDKNGTPRPLGGRADAGAFEDF